MKLCVGLTGGIGSGKSTVAGLFAKLGADIIDTDAIAHSLTQSGGEAIPAIRTAFGNDFLTEAGALDRTKMRALIFSDAVAKQQLEKILHPLIRERASAMLQQPSLNPYTILVVPLLPESKAFQQMVQRILVVDCDEKVQIGRVMRRNGMPESEVLAIIARQTTRAGRLALADDILYNDAGLGNLENQVAVLHEHYLRLSNNKLTI